jgi:aspartate carbamoyltransferase catalytic subunit
LRGKSVFNLFFENSTRTRTTFEIAASRLSADVINLNVNTSSTAKGESLLDTIDNLAAMHADMFVVRHAQSGAPYLIAQHVAPHVHVVNAGDGRHAPSHARACWTSTRSATTSRTSATCAWRSSATCSTPASRAIRHPRADHDGCSRVRVIGPWTLLPARPRADGRAVPSPTCGEGLTRRRRDRHASAAERAHAGALLPSAQEYFKHYGLTQDKLAHAKPDAIVMHPGPMNRGVEIDSAVADGPQSVILAAGDLRHRRADGGDEHPRGQLTMKLSILNARVIDPSTGFDQVTDLHVAEGRIAGLGPVDGFAADRTIDGTADGS